MVQGKGKPVRILSVGGEIQNKGVEEGSDTLADVADVRVLKVVDD